MVDCENNNVWDLAQRAADQDDDGSFDSYMFGNQRWKDAQNTIPPDPANKKPPKLLVIPPSHDIASLPTATTSVPPIDTGTEQAWSKVSRRKAKKKRHKANKKKKQASFLSLIHI